MLIFTKVANHKQWTSHCGFLFIYGLIVIIVVPILVGHIFGSWVFSYFKFVKYPYVSLLQFFVGVTLFSIHHVNVIVSECYPGWLFLETCRPSVGHSSFVQEDSPDFHTMGLCSCCCDIHSNVVRTSLRCGTGSLSS